MLGIDKGGTPARLLVVGATDNSKTSHCFSFFFLKADVAHISIKVLSLTAVIEPESTAKDGRVLMLAQTAAIATETEVMGRSNFD